MVVALPVDAIDGRCPPPGEGRNLCILQKVWLHELTVVFAVTAALLLAGYLLIFKLPDLFRRWRAGDLSRDPPSESDDPLLLAATWGFSAERGRRRRFRPRPTEPSEAEAAVEDQPADC